MKTITARLTLIALALSATANAQNFNARHLGQGFTSITQDFTASLSNPALLTRYDEDDDSFTAINFGALLSDEHDVFDTGEAIADNIDRLSDDIDRLSNDINAGNITTEEQLLAAQQNLQAQVNNITSDLAAIDDKPLYLRQGINAFTILPNQYLSFGLFINQYGRLGVAVDYDENDATRIQLAIDTLNETLLDDLSSSGKGIGYSVVEAGVMLGKTIIDNENYTLSLGTKIKYQRLDLLFTELTINDFDQDEFEFDDDLADTDGTNFDLGVYVNWGDNRQWHFAFVADNLAEQEINFRPSGSTNTISFSLESSAKVGLSYQQDWYSISTELDLTDREGFDNLAKAKYAAVGAELKWSEHAQLRLGARTDLNDTEADLYTVGIGLSPWDIFSLDIAAATGDKDTVALAIQLGLKL